MASAIDPTRPQEHERATNSTQIAPAPFRAILAICAAAAGFFPTATLMTELTRELLWLDSQPALFATLVVAPASIGAGYTAVALASRMPSRPALLTPIVLAIASLVFAVFGTWSVRAVSDQVATAHWSGWEELALARSWATDYQARYRRAALSTAAADAWRDQNLRSLGLTPTADLLPDSVRELTGPTEPTAYTPNRAPDRFIWRVHRERTGPFAYQDVFTAVLTARWHWSPTGAPPFNDGTGRSPAVMTVVETLQWVGPPFVNHDGGWQLVTSRARLDY